MSKDFKRHEHHKLGRISTSWRKPRGLHHKVRLEKKGYSKKVKIGYGTSGKPSVFVINSTRDIEEALQATKKGSVVVFSSTLGMRKKQALMKIITEKGITITNIPENYDAVVSETIASRKELKKARAKRRESRQKELQKSADKKKADEKKEDKSSETETTGKESPAKKEEDKKQTTEASLKDEKNQEKKERDKVLIHKE